MFFALLHNVVVRDEAFKGELGAARCIVGVVVRLSGLERLRSGRRGRVGLQLPAAAALARCLRCSREEAGGAVGLKVRKREAGTEGEGRK